MSGKNLNGTPELQKELTSENLFSPAHERKTGRKHRKTRCFWRKTRNFSVKHGGFSRSIATKSFHMGRRHADIRQHCFATCMMIALPAAEGFRGRRSREENRGGLRANGRHHIIKAMKSGELREDGKYIHWILLCVT